MLHFPLQSSAHREHLATDLPRLTRSSDFAVQLQPDTCQLKQLDLKPSPNPPSPSGSRQPHWSSGQTHSEPKADDKCLSFHWNLPSGTYAEDSALLVCHRSVQGLSSTATTLGGDNSSQESQGASAAESPGMPATELWSGNIMVRLELEFSWQSTWRKMTSLET